MQLLTDYPQWYDGIFDASPPVFHRQAFTRGGLSKRRQFALFESLGLPVPRHGVVREVVSALTTPALGCPLPPEAVAELRLVVYVDEFAHGGNGKRLLPLAEALVAFPEAYSSVFHLPPPGGRARTFRLARVGRLVFWLEQRGEAGDWRSNRQDTERVVSCRRTELPNPIPRVLWAIDFVVSADGLLAVDFNTAPDLSTLGECGVLDTKDVAAELEWAQRMTPDLLRQF